MNWNYKKYGLLILVFIICGFLNYHPQMLFALNSPRWGWFFSMLATGLIVFIVKQRDAEHWKQKLGIAFKVKDLLYFIMITVVLLVLFYFVVDYVAGKSGYDFKPKLFYYKFYGGSNYPFHYVLASYLYYLPQTFNEEMIIGAFLLLGIEWRFKNLNRVSIAIIVALVFSLMHQGLYRWSPVQAGGLLTLSTIVTLFFVGVLRNALILKTRNITWSWAIHLCFNFIFFSGYFVNITTQNSPSEPEVFNIVFGNSTMLIATGLIALISLIWLIKDKTKNKLIA